MFIRLSALAALVATSALASERKVVHSVSEQALVAKPAGTSTVLLQAQPAGTVIRAVLFKVTSATGRLASVNLVRGNGTGALAVTSLNLARGERVDALALLRDPALPGHHDDDDGDEDDASHWGEAHVARATATVAYEPDLSVALTAPASTLPGQVAIAATVSEVNGDTGAAAVLTLTDGAATLGTANVTVPAGGNVTVPFSAALTAPGAHALKAQLSALSLPEENAANDAASTTVNVIASVTASIDSSGGILGLPNGASVSLPFGAVDGATSVTVTQTTQPVPGGVGAVFEFDPQSLVLARPATVTLPLPGGVSAACIYFSRLDGSGWDAIGGDITGAFVSAQTPHLGFAVVGAPCGVRTVNGVGFTTWLSATARVSEPIDFGGQGVEALVSDGHGGLTSIAGIAGTGTALGTFTIPGVPVGKYILHSGQQYLVTASNTPDLGSVQGGKPLSQRQALTQPTTLNLSVTNLAPYDPAGFIEFYSTEENDWDFGADTEFGTLNPGDTTASLAIDLSALDAAAQNYAIQGSQGDHALIAQIVTDKSSTGVTYQHMVRAAALPAFDLLDGASVSTSVALQDVSRGSTLSVDYRGTQFVQALQADGNPRHVTYCPAIVNWCGGFAAMLAQPGDAQDGFYSANGDPLLLNDGSANGRDIQSGVMTYGAPGDTTLPGSWGLMFDARWTARVPTTPLPGTRGITYRALFPDSIEWTAYVDEANGKTITPPISLVRNLSVDGASAFAGGSVGLTPTIRWSAPTIGAPAFYQVAVVNVVTNANNLTNTKQVAHLITPDTSIQLPPGLLQANQPYLFTVSAVVATVPQTAQLLASAPFRSSIDTADSIVTSQTFWTGTPPATNYGRVSIIANAQFPIGITATATALYWAERVDNPWDGSPDSGQGRIWTADLDGSNARVLVSGQHDPEGVAADANAVYWLNSGDHTVMKYDLASGAVSTIATNQNYVSGGIVDVNGQLFWSGGPGIQTLTSSGPQVVAYTGAVNLDSDGASLFWTNYGASQPQATGTVVQMPLGGGAQTTLASGLPQAWDVHVANGQVFFSYQAWQSTTVLPAIQSVPVGGGAVTTVATGQSTGNSQMMKVFAADGQFVYYVDHRILWKAPAAGGPRIEVAPLQMPLLDTTGNGTPGCPSGKMVVRGGNLYWTDTCSQSVVHVTW